MQLSPHQLILAGKFPMPPSANGIWDPKPRKRKDEDAYYATLQKSPAAIIYELKVRSLISNPVPPWTAWFDPRAVRALREQTEIGLDLEIWEFYKSDKGGDIDNRVKAFQDVLCNYLDINDSRVTHGQQFKRVHPKFKPHIMVSLRVAQQFDVLQEQQDLNTFMNALIEREKNRVITENRAYATAATH